jgi:hypothetical protein
MSSINLEIEIVKPDVNISLIEIPQNEITFDFIDVLKLGETSTTAYRGDRGKIAYDHTLRTDNPHNVNIASLGALRENFSTLAEKLDISDNDLLAIWDNTTNTNKKIPFSVLMLSQFDKVIKTQEQFNDLIRYPNWDNAENVALIGEFVINYIGTPLEMQYGLLVPPQVKSIVGFRNAKITVNYVYSPNIYDEVGGLYRKAEFRDNPLVVQDLEVVSHTITDENDYAGGVCFAYLDNLINCKAVVSRGTNLAESPCVGFLGCNTLYNCSIDRLSGFTDYSVWGYGGCKNIINCKLICSDMAIGFSNCDNITSCEIDTDGLVCFGGAKNISNCTIRGNIIPFLQCSNISNCYIDVSLGKFSALAGNNQYNTAFILCTNISDIVLTTTSTLRGVGYAGCKNISNSITLVKSTDGVGDIEEISKVAFGCYVNCEQLTNCVGDIGVLDYSIPQSKIGFYVFSDIQNASNCTSEDLHHYFPDISYNNTIYKVWNELKECRGIDIDSCSNAITDITSLNS